MAKKWEDFGREVRSGFPDFGNEGARLPLVLISIEIVPELNSKENRLPAVPISNLK